MRPPRPLPGPPLPSSSARMLTMKAAALAALLLRPLLARAACEGDVSSFTGACTYDNFVRNLIRDCTVDELFPAGDGRTAVDAHCAYGGKVRFEEIQGTYQKDRRYFYGAGTMVDGAVPAVEMGPITRFEKNLADSTLIEFPEYASRAQYNAANGLGNNGYPANLNIEAECGLQTIMCCFIEGDFAGHGDATTDVCHHDLHNSPQANHIKHGWSAFPGAEGPTHCVGFTWESDTEPLGNMLYDVSLRRTASKGYVRGILGAPLCGCAEHMPVVEEAACRTATQDGEPTYTFHYAPDDAGGYLSLSNTVAMNYADCAAGDLKAQYKANHADDAAKAALIDAHLVGPGGCAASSYLSNTRFTVEGSLDYYSDPDPALWSDLQEGYGVWFQPPKHDRAAADAEFRALIGGGCKHADGSPRHCLVRRKCASCQDSHKDVFYQRLTALPPADVDFLEYFVNQWNSAHNSLHHDFELYSSYDDALAGANEWAVCNYDHSNIGFPRDCGPYHLVGGNWNSMTHTNSHGKHHGFWVELPGAGDGDDLTGEV